MQLLWRNSVIIAMYDALSIAKSILGRDWAALRGRLDVLSDVRALLRQRRQILGKQSAYGRRFAMR